MFWKSLPLIVLSVFLLLVPLKSFAGSEDAAALEAGQTPETAQIDPDGPIFPEAVEITCPKNEKRCHGDYPVRTSDENKLALLTNGEAGLTARLRTLRNARRSIRIEALEFTGDETGYYIADILKRKKAEGLDVRVIVDGFSNFAVQTKQMYVDMMDNGIQIQGAVRGYPGWLDWFYDASPFHPTHINMRFHEKLWIIDGEDPENGLAIVGGMNIANGYLRVGKTPFRDQDVIVKGPVVGDVMDAFDRNYREHVAMESHYPRLVRDAVKEIGEISESIRTRLTGPKFTPQADTIYKIAAADPAVNPSAPPLPSLEPATLEFFHNRPRHKESIIKQVYVDLIRQAATDNGHDSKEILIENAYFVPTTAIKNALKDAVKNGAHVVILTNSSQTTDHKSLVFVARWFYKPLLALNQDPQTIAQKGKIEIWEWHGRGLLHAKFAVFNRRRALVGSYNLDPRSEHLNSEDVMTFENPTLASDLARQFLNEDLAKSTPITLEEATNFRRVKNLVQGAIGWIRRHVETPFF